MDGGRPARDPERRPDREGGPDREHRPSQGGPPHGEVAKIRRRPRHRSSALDVDRPPRGAPDASAARTTPLARRRRTVVARLKPLVFVLALLPLAALAWAAYTDALGANPIKELEHATGRWAIRFLALSLAVTPLRKLSGWGELARYRRPLGLFAFFYATLHLAVFAVLDLELDLGDVGREIVKRPYITVGFASWLLLVPLAMTSTKGWIRRLGARRWNRLHRVVYVVAVAATVHFFWSQKKDVTDPLVFSAVLAPLLAYRLWTTLAARRSTPGRSSTADVRG